MSHRLGSVLAITPQVQLGPGSPTPATSPSRWDATHAVDPIAKFVMLHFDGSQMGPGDRIEVNLLYATDIYRPTWGPDFWTRPIRGGVAVQFSYFAQAGATGSATLIEYARGEAMRGDGALLPGYRNTNADLFMIDGPYQEPPYYPAFAVTTGHTTPSWVPALSVTASPVPAIAERVGMMVEIHHPSGAEPIFPEDGTPPIRVSSCTATLIAPDLIITAGHCGSTDNEIKTGSFTLDFQTEADGTTVPVGYSPKFFKMKHVVRSGFARAPSDMRTGLDYTVIQIEAAPGDVPATPAIIRTTPVPDGEPLFVVHHRRGTPKKVSRFPTDTKCTAGHSGTDITWEASVDYGSSGSSVFDSFGQIVANMRNPGAGPSILTIATDLANDPPPPRDIDVVLILDRSGSMSLAGMSGTTKMAEAKEAGGLFVSLLDAGRTHRVGLVSFSTTSSNERGLDAVASARAPLIGTGGKIPLLAAGGSTTIGGGLLTAVSQFPPSTPAANTRAVLLMSDGLENTFPWISNAEASLASSVVHVVGFGTEANLDGAKLTQFALRHNGLYMRAHDGLALEKFFALAFGHIFDYDAQFDPEYDLATGVYESAPVTVNVCGETTFIAVAGWNGAGASLELRITAPAGATVITAATAGVTAGRGATWTHLRFALPFAGHHDGAWTVQVVRPAGRGEFSAPAPALRYFLTTFVEGGPYLRPLMRRHFYTGDVVNPRVELRYDDGDLVHDAVVTLEVTVPSRGTGDLLFGQRLRPPVTVDGDVIDARAATLIDMEREHGAELVPASARSFDLFDDGLHDDGGMESDGVFGNPIGDLTRYEGNYTFHARATYGDACVAARETTWSAYVSVGIDSTHTTLTTSYQTTLPDSRDVIRVTIIPRDRFGGALGPGRGGSFTVQPCPGSSPDGGVVDEGDGTYTQVIVFDPTAGYEPGVAIAQPDRPTVIVGGGPTSARPGCRPTLWMWVSVALFILLLVAIALLIVRTP